METINKEANWSRKYGANHLAVVNLRERIRDIRESILEELKRLRESYLSNYEIAQAATRRLRSGLPRVLCDRNPSEGTASRGHMRAYVARSVGSRSLSRAKKLANKATSA